MDSPDPALVRVCADMFEMIENLRRQVRSLEITVAYLLQQETTGRLKRGD